MEFKDLFAILKNRISDGADAVYFFRDLMAMITEVTEEEWGTSKDPNVKCKDETIRTYTKRGFSKKLAQTIVYRLTPENLAARINERPRETLELLADDLKSVDAEVTADNVAQTIADMLVDIIRLKAGLVPLERIEKSRLIRQAAELKAKHGEYLLDEANYCCPFPGCGRALIKSQNEMVSAVYEVTLVDKQKSPAPDNLLAMCPNCQATYAMDNRKKVCTELKAVKRLLTAQKQTARLLDDLPLEKGVVGVIKNVSKLKEKDLSEAQLDPKELKRKISPDEDYLLYSTVNNLVMTYYISIRKILMNADKKKEIDYEEVQDQMHAFYRKLKKANKTKTQIFDELSGKLHKVSLQNILYCQVVVAYFIQSCEVFDAIAE